MFLVGKQSRNEGDNRAVAPFEIFSCEVQHQRTIILLPPKISSAGCGPVRNIDIPGSIHGVMHRSCHFTLSLFADFVYMAT